MNNLQLFSTESIMAYCILLLNNKKINPDYKNYQKRESTKYVENSSFFRHLQDEKEIMSSSFNNLYIPPKNCTEKKGAHKEKH